MGTTELDLLRKLRAADSLRVSRKLDRLKELREGFGAEPEPVGEPIAAPELVPVPEPPPEPARDPASVFSLPTRPQDSAGVSAEEVSEVGVEGLGGGEVFGREGRIFKSKVSGKLLYDSPKKFKDGRTPTQDVKEILEVLPESMTIEQYQDFVLRKPKESFSEEAFKADDSMDSLVPEAQTKLGDFIERLEEMGHSVEVRETRRPQERQEWLFQQGRSRCCRIVTWTLTSDHRTGRAIDVFIDGDRAGDAGVYGPAWDLAESMGISTLRELDPGHFAVEGGSALGDDSEQGEGS